MELVVPGAIPPPGAEQLLAQIKLEEKIRDGAENMLLELEVDSGRGKSSKVSREHQKQIVAELEQSTAKIDDLRTKLKDMGYLEQDGAMELVLDESRRGSSAGIALSSSRSRVALPLPDESPERYFSNLFDQLDPKASFNANLVITNHLAHVLSAFPVLKSEFSLLNISEKVREFLLTNDTKMIALAYRICSLVITHHSPLVALRRLNLEHLLVITLAKPDELQTQHERIQAILLIRSCITTPNGMAEMPVGLIRALVAVAETSSDKLCGIATETLAEMVLMDPVKLQTAGAIRVMVKVLLEGPLETAVVIAQVFNRLLDSPESRACLRDGKVLDGIVTVFTDIQLGANPPLERFKPAAAVIVAFLRCWSGLHSVNVKNLVDCLIIPVSTLQFSLLGIFQNLLEYKPNSIINQYTAYLLKQVLDAGLLDKLARIQIKPHSSDFMNSLLHENANRSKEPIEKQTKAHIMKSTLEAVEKARMVMAVANQARELTATIYQLIGHIMPNSLRDQYLQIPPSMAGALNRVPQSRIAAIPIYGIDSSLKRSIGGARPLEASPSDTYIKIGSQIDDATFKQMLNSTHVLDTKIFTRWNWDTLLEVIQGPLRNPRRVEELIKNSKFLKRITNFYRPFKHRFADIKVTAAANDKYVRVAKELILALLDTPEGARFLAHNNKVLRQIAECICQLEPLSGITSSEPMFSRERLRKTLAYGYFTILGALSKSRCGQAILSELRIFNMMHQICETDRDDVMRLFLTAMDYSFNGHPRIILSKALTAGNKSVRLFATQLLGSLVDNVDTPWLVDLLVTQLYDVDLAVCQVAVTVLMSACHNQAVLDEFIKLKPSVIHLGNIGNPLYMLFLSRTSGFQHLETFDYIKSEMDAWVHGQNETFVQLMENYLEPAPPQTPLAVLNAHQFCAGAAGPPRHFFGELVSTEQGCRLLRSTGYVDEFARYISCHWQDTSPEAVLKMKSHMWALGHIACRPLGAEFITLNMVRDICRLFDRSPVYSVSGTAFYCLGMVSSSFEGAELLIQCGWAATVGVHGDHRGIALVTDKEALDREIGMCESPAPSPNPPSPQDTFDFESEPLTPTKRQPLQRNPPSSSTLSDLYEFPKKDDPTVQLIMTAISDLSNHIMANDASKQLISLRKTHSHLFWNLDVFKSVLELLAKLHFKQVVRRFIMDLFDMNQIFERLVRKRSRHLF